MLTTNARIGHDQLVNERIENICGSELFGDPISPDLAQHELYEPVDAEFVKLLIESGHFRDGGPEVDIGLLEQLRGQREHDEQARAQLKELATYQSWFRYIHALNVRGEREKLDSED